MTTSTVEKPAANQTAYEELLKSKLSDTIQDIEIKTPDSNREDFHYYYSSGDFHFFLEHGFKPETLETTILTKVPFTPEWYDGIISIHGLIMPVIDILKFANSQNLNVKSNQNKKQYLLKLEHADYRPIVIKLDAIPQTINTKQLEKVNPNNDTPEWIKTYLVNESIKLALVDHNLLFDQLISDS